MESDLRMFRENNRNLSSSPSSMKLQEMGREVDLQNSLYVTLKTQYEKAKIDEVGRDDMVQKIDGPNVPTRLTSPKRFLSILMTLFISLFTSSFLIYFKENLFKFKNYFCSFMNSSTKIFKDTYFYYLSKIIPGIFALIFLTLFTRVIGINEYGKYSFYISQFNLIASFSFGWINQSQLRYGSKLSLSFKKYEYAFSILLSLMIAFLLSLIFNILSNYNNNFLLSIYCISSIGLFSFFKTFYQRKTAII